MFVDSIYIHTPQKGGARLKREFQTSKLEKLIVEKVEKILTSFHLITILFGLKIIIAVWGFNLLILFKYFLFSH